MEQNGIHRLDHAASNQFKRVKRGDCLWIITHDNDAFRLLGRLFIDRVVTHKEAERILKRKTLWSANFHVIARPGTAMEMQNVDLSKVLRRLRFIGPNSSLPPSPTAQSFQTMRELTSSSATLFESLIRKDTSFDAGDTQINVTVFHDSLQRNAHDLFQRWRDANPYGFFLNRKTSKNILLHNASCTHLGSTDWESAASLTEKQKICARLISQLQDWSSSHGISFRHCLDCKPEPESPEIVSETEYEKSLQGILFDSVSVDLPEDADALNPGRGETTIERIVRDTRKALAIKRLYKYECQICGHTIMMPDGSRYSEAHHIRRLGSPDNGPDAFSNLLCVCPNHHVALDRRALPISIKDLRLDPSHKLNAKQISYHNKLVKAATI